MKNKIIIVLLALLLFQCAAKAENPSNILVLEFTVYKNNTVDMADYYVDNGVPTVFSGEKTSYRITVYSKDRSTLYGAYFLPALEAIDTGSSGAASSGDYAYERIRLPFSEEMAYLEIYHSGERIYSLDLSPLCDHNGKCEGRENKLSCQSDCKAGEGEIYCNTESDGVCDVNCFPGWDPDCRKENETVVESTQPKTASFDYSPYLAAAALIIALAALFILRKRLVLLSSFFFRKGKT